MTRTAISKWESGRGYPSIESLKAIAKYFHVTIDELIGGEEMVCLAEQKITENRQRSLSLICGVLDCLLILLLFVPSFGQQSGDVVLSVGLLGLTQVSRWQKAASLLVCVIMGSAMLLLDHYLSNIHVRRFLKALCAASMGITAAGRLISGAHWFTDVVGGCLISSALLVLYSAAISGAEVRPGASSGLRLGGQAGWRRSRGT